MWIFKRKKVIFISHLLRQIGQNPYFCWFLVTLHRSFSSIFDPNDHVKALIPYHKTDWKWQTIGNKKNSCNVLSKSLEIEILHNAPKWIFQFLVPKYFRLHLVFSKNLLKTKKKKRNKKKKIKIVFLVITQWAKRIKRRVKMSIRRGKNVPIKRGKMSQ